MIEILSRAEIEERLTMVYGGMAASTPLTPGQQDEKQALQTAKQLGDWLDALHCAIPLRCDPCPFNKSDLCDFTPIDGWLAGETAESTDAHWLYLEAPDAVEPYIRVSRDGLRVQERNPSHDWTDYGAWWIKEAFGKGAEVGEAKGREAAAIEALETIKRCTEEA